MANTYKAINIRRYVTGAKMFDVVSSGPQGETSHGTHIAPKRTPDSKLLDVFFEKTSYK